MKKLSFILLFTFLIVNVFSQTSDDPNYKLGNFKNSQIKAASVNVGDSWTIKKNSTTKDLELYYGLTKIATLGTTGTLEGTTALRDTLYFGTNANGNRNKYIRVKIPGVTAGDIFVVTPLMANGKAIPGTAEFLGYYCTTDSLIISRNTASTSGLGVSYVRIK